MDFRFSGCLSHVDVFCCCCCFLCVLYRFAFFFIDFHLFYQYPRLTYSLTLLIISLNLFISLHPTSSLPLHLTNYFLLFFFFSASSSRSLTNLLSFFLMLLSFTYFLSFRSVNLYSSSLYPSSFARLKVTLKTYNS